MLERVALNQTRLRIPGLGLDARGVAVGARCLVLFPSLDRLVAFLSLFTEENSLESLEDLRIEQILSPLKTRELVLEFAVDSSERLDRVARFAEITNGFTFTGTSRHFVQYRDSAAPFGYDVSEVVPSDADLTLYHSSFTQSYNTDREVKVTDLLRRLMPHPDPTETPEELSWLLAAPGLGLPLARHLLDRRATAQVGFVQLNAETAFDSPVEWWLFRVETTQLVGAIVRDTPGLACFIPHGNSVAVEQGYRHPLRLSACQNLLDGFTLFRGRNRAPLILSEVPPLVRVGSLVRAGAETVSAPEELVSATATDLGVPLQTTKSAGIVTDVHGLLVEADDLELLRHLLYVLPPDAIQSTRAALTNRGVILLRDEGLEGFPLGTPFRRIHPAMLVSVGDEFRPRLSEAALFEALGAPHEHQLFRHPDGRWLSVPTQAFSPLERLLLRPERWAPLQAESLEVLEQQATPTVWLDPLGPFPLRSAK